MSSTRKWLRSGSLAGRDPCPEPSPVARSWYGHSHFWKRALSRRQFLWTAAGTAAALGTGLILPTPALAAGRDPRPIPGGFGNPTGGPFLHLYLPGPADAPPAPPPG